MTFDEVRAEFARLNAERSSKRLDENSFQQRVGALRAQDRFGRLWQITAAGEWMRWTGSAWAPDAPPADVPAAERSRVGPLCCAKCGAEVALGRKFCSKCGGPITETTVYMRSEAGELGVAPPPPPAQTAAQTTQGRSSTRPAASASQTQSASRPGAVCAFCRTPLRPGKKFCTACGKAVGDTTQTVRPPASAAPPPPTVTQRPAAPASTPAPPTTTQRPTASPGTVTRPRTMPVQAPPAPATPTPAPPAEHQPVRPWDIVAVAGCSAISGAWFWYSGMADTSPDYLTCASIVALPVAKILLRDKISRALAPLRSTVGRIPGKIRAGMGLAIPFLISNQLYTAGSSQFPYMFKTTVISAIASFVMLHVPAARGARH